MTAVPRLGADPGGRGAVVRDRWGDTATAVATAVEAAGPPRPADATAEVCRLVTAVAERPGIDVAATSATWRAVTARLTGPGRADPLADLLAALRTALEPTRFAAIAAAHALTATGVDPDSDAATEVYFTVRALAAGTTVRRPGRVDLMWAALTIGQAAALTTALAQILPPDRLTAVSLAA